MDYAICVLKVRRNELQGNILTFQQLEAEYQKKGNGSLAKAYQNKVVEANDKIDSIDTAIEFIREKCPEA